MKIYYCNDTTYNLFIIMKYSLNHIFNLFNNLAFHLLNYNLFNYYNNLLY